METNEGTGTYEEVFNRNYGFYLIADQKIWQNRNSNSSLNIFIQFAKSPQNINTHDFYLGGGLNMFGVLDKSGNDALGIAFARSGFHNSIHNHETAIEVYYKTRINEHITIQPDIQYIINPAGTDTILESALAAFFRFDINF
jgi:porin